MRESHEFAPNPKPQSSIMKTTNNNNNNTSHQNLPSNPPNSPNFFTCHCCNTNNCSPQTLESQWRIVLLCQTCLARIQSAAICSYCFKARDLSFLICRVCARIVHLTCIPIQRGYISKSDFDPVSFTCVDCCAIPRRRCGDEGVCRGVLEVLGRDLRFDAKKKGEFAARARFRALKKADEARVCMELAFDAILFARDVAVIDGKSNRRGRRDDLGDYFRVKKGCGGGRGGDSMRGKSNKWRGRIRTVRESNVTLLSERNSCVKSGVDARCASGSMEVELGKKKGRCCDVAGNYDGEVGNDGLRLVSCRESADSNSFVEGSECGRGGGEDCLKLKKEKECSVLKCCKVNSRLKRY